MRPISITWASNSRASSKASPQVSFFFPSDSCARLITALIICSFLSICTSLFCLHIIGFGCESLLFVEHPWFGKYLQPISRSSDRLCTTRHIANRQIKTSYLSAVNMDFICYECFVGRDSGKLRGNRQCPIHFSLNIAQICADTIG